MRVCVVTVLLLFSAWCCLAADRYTLTDLGDLPGGNNRSSAHALNARGHVAGVSSGEDGWRLFLWTPEDGMRDLAATSGRVSDLNNHDAIIVSTYDYEFEGELNYLWTEVDGMRWLGEVTGDMRYQYTTKFNDSGQMVGRHFDDTFGFFVWDANSGVAVIPVTQGTTGSEGGINATGQFAGTIGLAPFRWDAVNGIIVLGDLPGGNGWNDVSSINDHGHVVGSSSVSTSAAHAFLWSPELGMVDLGEMDTYDNGSYFGNDVNNHDEVVGYVRVDDDSLPIAFVWSAELGMRELQGLIDPTDPLHGRVHIGWATSINDAGQIAVDALVDGIPHAVLMTPLPDENPAGPPLHTVPIPLWAHVALASWVLFAHRRLTRRPHGGRPRIQ